METNLIYYGDNLEVLAKFPDKSVDLIYADPPFFSNKQYKIIWDNGAEMKVYEDRWKGGINIYISWMEPRIAQCQRVLKDTGSMYLHCDWHANAHLRILMDEIFGDDNFLNEIVWSYETRTMPTKWFARKHDAILFYKKDKGNVFNIDAVRVAYRPESLVQYDQVDEHGRRYKRQSGGQRTYLSEKGKPCPDVWQIQIPGSRDPERTGYPTQKPEALLERIIKASSNEGDIVLDPFCGCGTTLVVAHQFDRKWIGIDVSPIACNLMKDRLTKVGISDVRIIGAPKTVDELKKLV